MKAKKELITQLRKGNILAFNSIYQLYSSHVYNFICSLVSDNLEVEDLTQEVFVRLWERRESLDCEKNFDSYVFAIARNLVYDQWESRLHADNYLKSLELEAEIGYIPESEEKLIADFTNEYIDKLIDKLPESRREIFILSRKRHLSNKEIAQRLSISERTVETQIYRSLQFLRVCLNKEGILTYLLLFIVNKW